MDKRLLAHEAAVVADADVATIDHALLVGDNNEATIRRCIAYSRLSDPIRLELVEALKYAKDTLLSYRTTSVGVHAAALDICDRAISRAGASQ